MHGAHPGHLAFKLLGLLSVFLHVSRLLSPLALPFLAHVVPLVLPFARVRTYRTASDARVPSLFRPQNARLYLRLCLSRGISSSPLPLPSPCNFPTASPDPTFSPDSAASRLLIFYSSSWHRDKNAHVLPYPRAGATFGEGTTGGPCAGECLRE